MALEKEAVLAAAPSDSPTMSATWNLVWLLTIQKALLLTFSVFILKWIEMQTPPALFFVTMQPLAEKALLAIEKGELTIIPERFEKTNIKDWCISRQLWWGTAYLGIPVWYIVGKDCKEEYIVAKSAEEALMKARDKYGNALWPFSTLGWPDVSAEDFKRFYPITMLEIGHDILFFWVARIVMIGTEFTGTVPFSYVYLHGLIRDSQVSRVSELGYYLGAHFKFGNDALRFTLALGTAGQDLNLSTERLTTNTAFTIKLWNAGKFVLQVLPNRDNVSGWQNIEACKFNTEGYLLRLHLPECWVVSKLHMLVDAVTESYNKFFFGDVGREIYDFFWGGFADWYIEASKARLYHSGDDSVALVTVILYVFENILKLITSIHAIRN
ncbi:hypothetical protein PVK06_007244 [Gossypium arboreum]|uniref:valine--tRNA ligase n=1 Tax=Gossypium arboreum TaxID=29729 RepID=A0ABR0QH01_GOSAR|nr:hypothetical protein PVK06_007244 [Gossypium arboreum]